MHQFKIRFNTECKDKNAPHALCWRAIVNDKEILVSDIQINVPVKTISHEIEAGTKKWSIYCEANSYVIDHNNKLIINPQENFKPCVIWFTGLSGAGKTTTANALAQALTNRGAKVIGLDGDEIRNFFKIGFDKQARVDHNLNVGRISAILVNKGFTVIVSLISPYKDVRKQCREMVKSFMEIYINTPIEVCETRDPKGLYARVRCGELKRFTGIDDPYEAPSEPELFLDTSILSTEECVQRIIHKLNYV